MPDSHEDLWGEEIKSDPLPAAPVSILREQAALLAEKTNNDLKGEVETSASGENRFSHSFYIVAPGLDDYRYRLFYINHDVLLYPLQIGGLSNASIKEAAPPGNNPPDPTNPFMGVFPPTTMTIQAENEAGFKILLKKILSSEETARIVKSLLGQIRG